MSRSKPRSRSVIHVYCRDSCRPAFFEVIPRTTDDRPFSTHGSPATSTPLSPLPREGASVDVSSRRIILTGSRRWNSGRHQRRNHTAFSCRKLRICKLTAWRPDGFRVTPAPTPSPPACNSATLKGTPHPPIPQYPSGFFARYCW